MIKSYQFQEIPTQAWRFFLRGRCVLMGLVECFKRFEVWSPTISKKEKERKKNNLVMMVGVIPKLWKNWSGDEDGNRSVEVQINELVE